MAAAGKDFEKHQCWVDRQCSSAPEEFRLPPHTADFKQIYSPQRRKLFRHAGASPSKGTKKSKAKLEPRAIPKVKPQNVGLLRQHVQTPCYISVNKESQRENVRMDARRKRGQAVRSPRGNNV